MRPLQEAARPSSVRLHAREVGGEIVREAPELSDSRRHDEGGEQDHERSEGRTEDDDDTASWDPRSFGQPDHEGVHPDRDDQ